MIRPLSDMAKEIHERWRAINESKKAGGEYGGA
ncbi:MAG: hypothetical protein JWM83_1646 [Candidatus Angelobacter sp.]|jgi:hypothetical protein|nr:hypothetical protein [Candidatus Angelobacter sp.]